MRNGLDDIGARYNLDDLSADELAQMRREIVDLQDRAIDALEDMQPSLKANGSEFTPDQLGDMWNDRMSGSGSAAPE